MRRAGGCCKSLLPQHETLLWHLIADGDVGGCFERSVSRRLPRTTNTQGSIDTSALRPRRNSTMPAQIIDGKAIAAKIRSELKTQIESAKYVLDPVNPYNQLTFLHPPVRATVGEVRYSIEIDVGGE